MLTGCRFGFGLTFGFVVLIVGGFVVVGWAGGLVLLWLVIGCFAMVGGDCC